MFLMAVSSLNLSIRLLYRYWRLHSRKKLLVWSLGSSMLRRYVIFLSLLWLCKGLLVVRGVLCTGSAFERLCMAHFSLLRFEIQITKPRDGGKKFSIHVYFILSLNFWIIREIYALILSLSYLAGVGTALSLNTPHFISWPKSPLSLKTPQKDLLCLKVALCLIIVITCGWEFF